MTAKIDGTNGLIQQYVTYVPTTGFSYTFPAGTTTLVMIPAGALASGTITMPAAPADGMTITISSSRSITSLTVSANTGQSITNTPTSIGAGASLTFVYQLSNTTWYPISPFPTGTITSPTLTSPTINGTPVMGASVITARTAVASTSGTSIDFTSIPSWVNRITVMFTGVTKSSTANILVQLGTGGSPTTTGYSSMATYVSTAVGAATANTTGFATTGLSISTATLFGNMVFTNLTGNVWTGGGVLMSSTPTPLTIQMSGSVSLAGVLNLVRITTTSTDTFTAGTVNIFYE